MIIRTAVKIHLVYKKTLYAFVWCSLKALFISVEQPVSANISGNLPTYMFGRHVNHTKLIRTCSSSADTLRRLPSAADTLRRLIPFAGVLVRNLVIELRSNKNKIQKQTKRGSVSHNLTAQC